MTVKSAKKTTGRQGNPVGSPWRSTPDEKRKRKRVILTLELQTIDRLQTASKTTLLKPMSQIAEEAILEFLDKNDS